MSRAHLTLFAVLLAAAASACVSAIPQATEADLGVARERFGDAVTVADLDGDRSLYVKRCAGCHNLYEPTRKSPNAWPATVADMGARGDIPQGDLKRIERYLVTMSGRAKR